MAKDGRPGALQPLEKLSWLIYWRPRGRGKEKGRWAGATSKGLNKGNCSSSIMTVCSAGNAPGRGRGRGKAGVVLGFPCRSWPSCKQLQQEASLSILQQYSQLYSQTRCPEQLGVTVQGVSRLGAAAQVPLAPSPQGGSGKSPRCDGPGESDAPQKRTLHPEGSRGRSHNGPSPCRRKQRVRLCEGSPGSRQTGPRG